MSTKQFRVFDSQTRSTSMAEPQLDVNWYQNDKVHSIPAVYAQGSAFHQYQLDMPEAKRVHFRTNDRYSLSNNWSSLNTGSQADGDPLSAENVDWYNNRYGTDLDESVNRVLPQFKMDGKLIPSSAIWVCWRGWVYPDA